MEFIKSIVRSKWFIIACLILAGEMIFGLPFHVVRYFRPTFLEVFQISNTELGDAMAFYGVTAMLSYFPGGILADRFSARRLMSLSLIATALGGLMLLSVPGKLGLSLIFGYWGITTILLFWSAMMRTTREWGGKMAQGRAFGILDGGRGLAAAGVASLAVILLGFYIGDKPDAEIFSSRLNGLKAVILFYCFFAFIAAILVWIFIPDKKLIGKSGKMWAGIISVAKNRSAWYQAIIVVCAYCGYRGLDFYGIYGVEFLGMDEIGSSRFVSNAAYLRAVGAIAAGFIADRFSTRKTILSLFTILTICYGLMIIIDPITGRAIIMANLVITFLAVYALRGIYFALFEEMKVSGSVTGTTVGLVSFVGYTPDIFFNSIAGRIIDSTPGLGGYHNFYLLLTCFAISGLIVSLFLISRIKTKRAGRK